MTRDEKRKTKNLLPGFTLLETIVALAIIIAAVIGPVVLITSSLFSFGFSKNKLIALNLAQEGLELVRAMRENNVLCDEIDTSKQRWFENPSGGGQMNNEDFEIDIISTDNLDCVIVTIVTPHISNYSATKLRLDPATGIYSYGGGQETIFTREMLVKKPDNHEALPGEDIRKEDIREVTSIVRWKERGMDRSVTLKEKLYNWK